MIAFASICIQLLADCSKRKTGAEPKPYAGIYALLLTPYGSMGNGFPAIVFLASCGDRRYIVGRSNIIRNKAPDDLKQKRLFCLWQIVYHVV